MESGWIIICMAKESILGEMVESMKGNIITIRNMDLGFTDGLMEEYIRDTGRMGSNMGKAGIYCLMEQ